MEEQLMKALRDQLEEERASIEQQLADLGATVTGDVGELPVDDGFADSAAATAERAEMLSLLEQLRSSYRDVSDALRRMDQGTYGKCERCGGDIAPERLQALPAARLCVRCKQKLARG